MPGAAIARSRAPTVFSVRMKSASVKKHGYENKGDRKLLFKIDDPRGRAAVRARARGLAPTKCG
jgi:hypothetical protein